MLLEFLAVIAQFPSVYPKLKLDPTLTSLLNALQPFRLNISRGIFACEPRLNLGLEHATRTL